MTKVYRAAVIGTSRMGAFIDNEIPLVEVSIAHEPLDERPCVPRRRAAVCQRRTTSVSIVTRTKRSPKLADCREAQPEHDQVQPEPHEASARARCGGADEPRGGGLARAVVW